MTDKEKFDRIGTVVASDFGFTLDDLLSPGRGHAIADARAIAIWIAARLIPDISRRRIAQGFGRKEANAVADALNRVEEIREIPSVREKADRLYDYFFVVFSRLPAPPPKTEDEPISSDAAWGFVGFQAQAKGKTYFGEMNSRFAEAMIEAGYRRTS